MSNNQYKINQRKLLGDTIHKIKSENDNENDINIIPNIKEKIKYKNPEKKKYYKKRNLNINDNLCKEMQEMIPQNNFDYQKSKYINGYYMIYL